MLLIQNGTVVDPKSHLQAKKDVLIASGTIHKIEDSIPKDSLPSSCQILSADGCIVCPGLIDTHSHFRDPGFTWKEDLHTGCLSAAKGGYTCVLLMANTNPPVDSPLILEDILSRSKKEKIHVFSAANVTKKMKGEELTDLDALFHAGAKVFTDDGVPIMNESLLNQALKKASSLGVPVSLHEENPDYIGQNGINAEGNTAHALGIKGSSRKAEISMILRDTAIAEALKAKLVIQHISTKEGVEIVRQSKIKNPNLRAEATPHHFTLTEDAVLQKGSLAKVNPPVRMKEDKEAIIRGMQDGTISFIATDHAPHSIKEKALPLLKAPSGMIGLETALSLALRELVQTNRLSLIDMLTLLTWNPARYYGLPGGEIREGGIADIVVFNPNEHWTVNRHFCSKSQNSPFIGETLPGVVHWTICKGEIVYSLAS